MGISAGIASALTSIGVGAETAATIGAGVSTISGIGSIVSGVGSIAKGFSSAASDRYSARVAENNAQIERQNSLWSREEGTAKAEQAQMANRAKVGGIVAEQAASGIDVNKGSAVDVQKSAAEIGQQNVIDIRAQAARQAYGYDTRAMNDVAQADLDKSKASGDVLEGVMGGAGTILSGVGQAGTAYRQWQNSNSAITWNPYGS